MLPNSLRGSYTIYKEDTDSVATWLASTAKQCGYPLDYLTRPKDDLASQKGSRLKGKAHELAKTAASAKIGSSGSTTYTIAVKDFIPLAEYIVVFRDPPVRVPSSLVHVLDRAIALRREHISWLNEFGRTSRGNGHILFLGILEQVREILVPRIHSGTSIDPIPRPSVNLESGTTSRAHSLNLSANLALYAARDKYSDPASILDPFRLLTEVNDQARYQAATGEQYLPVQCLSTDNELLLDSLWRLCRLLNSLVNDKTNTAVELL